MKTLFAKKKEQQEAKQTKKELATRRKPRPSIRYRTQSFINIRDVSDGIIITKDDRYIRIVEVLPTNFFNKDALEQERIVYQFAQYLSHAPKTMQVKVMSVPETAEDYLNILLSYKELPNATEQTREMIDDLAKEIKDTVEIFKLKNNRFFVIYEFEEFQMSPDFDYVRKVLLGHEFALAECMSKCGCKVVSPRLTNNQYINTVLYEYILLHFDRTTPDFETHMFQIYQDIAKRNPLKKDSLTIEDYLSPQEVSFYAFDFCEINGKYASYHYISDYRHYVTAGWLNPLLSSSYGVDVDIFFVRQDRVTAKKMVRRSVDMQEIVLGNLSSNTSVAQESRQNMQDALMLREKMYNESADMYDMSILITITADTLSELDDKIREVYNLMEARDMPLLPLELRQERAFRSTLPFVKLDKDILKISSRNILCGELASIFPFNEPSIFVEGGIFIGKNKAGRLCAINCFDTTKYDKPHMMIVGSTGSGKTYASQLILGRNRLAGAKCFAIAPIKGEEYRRFCENIGGTFIKLTTDGENYVNIFDIRIPDEQIQQTSNDNEYLGQKSYLSRKLIVVSAYFEILMPYLTPLKQSLLNVAIVNAYKEKGITLDNRSIQNPDGTYKEMPIISDVCMALQHMLEPQKNDEDAQNMFHHTMPDPKEFAQTIYELLGIMQQFVSGTYSFLNKHTNIADLDNDYIVFDISDLDSSGDKIVGAMMFTVLNHIMNIMSEDITQHKVLLIDELWKLVGEGSGLTASFVKEAYKIIRAYNGQMITSSQDIQDWKSKDNESVLNTIMNNSQFQILLKMQQYTLGVVSEMLYLNTEIRNQISMFSQRGDAMLICENNAFEIRFDGTPSEHMAITTDPNELAFIQSKNNGKGIQNSKSMNHIGGDDSVLL